MELMNQVSMGTVNLYRVKMASTALRAPSR